MRAVVAFLGLLLVGAAPPPATPGEWLQARMDRVGHVAGLAPGAVQAVLVDGGAMTLDAAGPTIAVPRALVAGAPSAQAVDGVLAMLLSYRRPEGRARRGASAGEVAALAALVAATGGVSEGKDTRTIPTGTAGRAVGEPGTGRDKALRGARWAEAAGGCTGEVAGYLRTLAHGPVADGSAVTARRILTDMGSLGYPSAQPCPLSDDEQFAAIRAQLAMGHML